MAVFDTQSSVLKLYLDGILVQENTSIAAECYGNVPQPTTIGCSTDINYADVSFFNGEIDDIGIWNRALTPAEIEALYNAQDGPCVSPDPVSFTGLGSSYTLADAPVTLAGSPAGGVFIGPGVSGSTFSPAAAPAWHERRSHQAFSGGA